MHYRHKNNLSFKQEFSRLIKSSDFSYRGGGIIVLHMI